MKVVRRESVLRPPVVGIVVGHEDDERVLVVWGDASLNPTEHLDEARIEQLEELVQVQ